MKVVADLVNTTKQQIDDLVISLDKFKLARQAQPEFDGDTEVIDEEEFNLLQKLKVEKQRYRDNRTSFTTIEEEVNYTQKLVEQGRQRLLSEFEQWYSFIHLFSFFSN